MTPPVTATTSLKPFSELGLPERFTELRDHQVQAREEIAQAYAEGAKVVFVGAPTGSGKTLLGEVARKDLGVRGLYVPTDRGLQDQFVRDFPYAKVVKGRSNYPTYHREDKTADDCTASGPGTKCLYCPSMGQCPYQVAKARAASAELAVLNTAYLLSAGNAQKSPFSGWPLMVLDEADVLESALTNYVEFAVGEGLIRRLGMKAPKKAVRKPRLIEWLNEFAAALTWYMKHHPMEPKERRKYQYLGMEAQRVAAEIQVDIDNQFDDEETGRWIRDYAGIGERGLLLIPVIVARYGSRFLWRHAKKFLVMSATLISHEAMASELGLVLPYSYVDVPMTFPKENRRVVYAPVASVTYKSVQEGKGEVEARLAYAIAQIARAHPGDRILVHCVSFKMAHELLDRVSKHLIDNPRRLVTHGSKGSGQHTREEALSIYRANVGAILFSAGMERGVDLKGDDCRVQIIAKMPFEALNDRRIKARMSLPGGQVWYSIQNVRKLVQMTGRAVRSADDWALTYILDDQFSRVWGRDKALLPEWWREAVDTGADIRWLLR